MPPQSQQQSGGGGDNSMMPVWVMVLFFVTLYLIWHYEHAAIVQFVFKINVLEAKFILLFVNDTYLENGIRYMNSTDPAQVSWAQFIEVLTRIGNYVRYPVAGILCLMAAYLYRSNIILKYKRAHSMKTLRAQEQANWTGIMPIIKEDLTKTDINQGPWAMALSPMEFAKKYQLLRKEDPVLDSQSPDQENTAGIRRGDAKRVFTLQLGPYFDGFDRISDHAAALAAVFMARMNRDRKSATMILDTINKTWPTGKPDYACAKPILKKYMNTEIVQEITQRHAYLLTVLASLLEKARDDGVVPCSEFLWLKPTDRRLWYMLNCVGRQTPFSEVAGPFAHWRAERRMGRRSLVPMIDEAIKALEGAVKSVKLPLKELQALEP